MASLREATDEALMARVRAGEGAAFSEILGRHERAVIGYLSRLLRDREDALDAAQEVFLRVHFRCEQYEPTFPFRCWLYRIATNVAIDTVRRRKRQGLLLLGDLLRWRDRGSGVRSEAAPDSVAAENASGALDDLLARERATQVRAAISTLPPRYRTVLVLRDLEDLAYEDVARILDCEVGTVKSRLNRARTLLREKLKSASRDTGRRR